MLLGLQKPVARALEIINLEDSGNIRVGHVNQVPSTIHDMSNTFGESSLNIQSASMKHKRTLSTGNILKPRKLFQRVQAGIPDEPTRNIPGQPGGATAEAVIKQ